MFIKKDYIFLILVVVILLIFLNYSIPLDKSVSILAFDKDMHRFYGQDKLWIKIIYSLIPWLTGVLIVLPIAILILSKMFSIWAFKPALRFAIIVLTSLALGPGLIINSMFKDNWGRPRPTQVLVDGKNYAPLWNPNFKSPENNSFPSGHAAIGFFLGVPFLALGYRRKGLLISIICGSIIGYVRIMQGGHYLSDIISSGIIVWLVAELILYIVCFFEKRYFQT